jgi:hypothetical protein
MRPALRTGSPAGGRDGGPAEEIFPDNPAADDRLTLHMKPNLSRQHHGSVLWSAALALALSVIPATARPANDDLSTATVITGASGLATGENRDATTELDEPDHADEQGGASVWWRWTAPADGMVTFDTFGSDFDTLLAVYTGDRMEDLANVASNDESGFGHQSMVMFSAVTGTTYRIAVAGYDHWNGSGMATGTIALHWGNPLANDAFAAAATITGNSGITAGLNEGATKEEGEPVHAGNAGGASLWWQWTASENGTVRFDTFGSNFDTLLAVYTGDSVAGLTPVAVNDDAGPQGQSMASFSVVMGTTYRIAVDGFAEKGPIPETGTVVLRWGAPLANDAFSAAIVISGASGAVTAANPGAGKEAGEPDHAGDPGGASVWWQWTAPASGPVAFDTFGSEFDTLLAIYTGDNVGSLTEVAAGDDAEDFVASMASFTAVSGTTYHIAVDGYDAEIGNIVLTWGPPAVNDNFSGATTLAGASGSAAGHTPGATTEEGEPDHAGGSATASVWWQWTAPANGEVTIDTFGSGFDTVLAVYTGDNVQSLTLVGESDDFGEYLTSRVSFAAVAGTTYRIAVGGFAGEMGTVMLHWGLPSASYALWISGKGLSGEAAAAGADPDADALPNGVEYVLGGDPSAGAAAATRPAVAADGDHLIFTFLRDDTSETPDVTLTVESGTDLVTWPAMFNVGANTAASSSGVTISENGTGPDTVTVAIPRGAVAVKFARLKVTIAP